MQAFIISQGVPWRSYVLKGRGGYGQHNKRGRNYRGVITS